MPCFINTLHCRTCTQWQSFLFSSQPALKVISVFSVSPLPYSGPGSICCLRAQLPLKPATVIPSCDSSAFQLLMSLLLFVFSAEAKYTNCSVDNGGCEHFCRDDPANQRRSCSCASGYQLMNDHTMCKPVGKRRMFVVQIWRRIIQTWHKRVLWENCLPCTLYWFSKHPFHAE